MIEIQLTQSKVAIIDDIDAELASLKWFAWCGPTVVYAMRHVRKGDGARTTEKLHRAVWARMHPGAPLPVGIDHRNGDGLDCRRVNLRAASTAENNRNKRICVTNTSGFVGVHRDRRGPSTRPWRAYASINGKAVYLGYHATAEQAARARDAAVRALGTEFGAFNFPEHGERNALCS